jgi:hypothetical protein
MTRQLYDLKHPLYPHKDLLDYHAQHKIAYQPYQGAYDDAYNQWYQLVRADHDFSGAPIRPIYREISQIIRLKSSGHEYILYGETLYGQDHENNTIPFFHTYGQYMKPAFKTVYNYELKQANTIRAGGVETVFFLQFDKKLLDELFAAGPDDRDIELLVNVGSRQYGGRGFFTYEEFRDSALEELARIGREGKGMYTTLTSNVPTATITQELKASGANAQQQSQLYKEFMEFQKFKQSQQQQQQQKGSGGGK